MKLFRTVLFSALASGTFGQSENEPAGASPDIGDNGGGKSAKEQTILIGESC